MDIRNEQYESVVKSLVSVIERTAAKEDATAEEIQALAAVTSALKKFAD